MTSITLSGPFFELGRHAETLRSAFVALADTGLAPLAYDLSRTRTLQDLDHVEFCRDYEVAHPTETAHILFPYPRAGASLDLAPVADFAFSAVYLSDLPSQWKDSDRAHLARFDEIWTTSNFVADDVRRLGHSACVVAPAVEPVPQAFLPRRFFGLPDSSFAVLAYVSDAAKTAGGAGWSSPEAVRQVLTAIEENAPLADIRFFVRVPENQRPTLPDDPRIKVVDGHLSEFEELSLLYCSDCLLSAHHATCFGRRLAQMMWSGRPVVATGWSGNMDYCADYGATIGYSRSRPDPEAEPTGFEMVEPDLNEAAQLILRLALDPDFHKSASAQAFRSVRRNHSMRAFGLRMSERLAKAGIAE